MKRIVFTGGGTAGHVVPNLPLMHCFQKRGWQVHYVGSRGELERNLVASTGATYHAIFTGKLRRYLTLVNVRDFFLVGIGLIQAFWLMLRLRPAVIFSKGGYVSFPVVVGGWLNRIPVVAHESDLSPGLANRLSYPFVKKICTTFAETVSAVPGQKAICTGTPIRPEVMTGNAEKGLATCGFSASMPVLLVIGGSLGAVRINETVRAALPILLETFQVAHICGAGNLSAAHEGLLKYRQFEFLTQELPDLFAMATLAVSRAGSNSLVELLSLGLPHLLIPLDKTASRGDQIENARMSEDHGWSMVLAEATLTTELLAESLHSLHNRLDDWQLALKSFQKQDAVAAIDSLLMQYAG